MCICHFVIASDMEKPLEVEIILTCEHAANVVPEKYARLFEGKQDVLHSHRGWDPGALELAVLLSAGLNVPLYTYPYTRLLIEPNRSLGHPKLYSEFSKILTRHDKDELIQRYYIPYREKIKSEISKRIKCNVCILHISIHTFTPVLGGIIRNVDIGILYDPARKEERNYSGILKRVLKKKLPGTIIKMNQPYKGISDGFTTALRKCFTETNYLGIELEINQKLLLNNTDELSGVIVSSVKEIFQS